MSADQLARAWANTMVIDERELPELSADQAGIVHYRPGDDGSTFAAVRRLGLSPDQAATFDAWARRRAYILAATGDLQIDGWFQRSADESWQITAKAVDLPDMRFIGD